MPIVMMQSSYRLFGHQYIYIYCSNTFCSFNKYWTPRRHQQTNACTRKRRNHKSTPTVINVRPYVKSAHKWYALRREKIGTYVIYMLLSLRRPKWKTGLVVHGNTRSADGQNRWHD